MATAATMTVQITIDIPDEFLTELTSVRPRVVVTDVTPPPPTSQATERASMSSDETDPDGADSLEPLPADVLAMISAEAPQANSELFRQFLERCVVELGARIAVPSSGKRPYVNIFPPAGRRGGRLAALNLPSGRLHTNLPPSRVGEWTYAEVVNINGQPDYLRAYLTPDSADDAFAMVSSVLADR